MEGVEDSEFVPKGRLIWNPLNLEDTFDELLNIMFLSREITLRIDALELDDVNNDLLSSLKSGVLNFCEKMGHLSNSLHQIGGEVEAGEGSTGRSVGESLQQRQSSTSEIETSSVPAISPPMPVSTGGSMEGYSPISGSKKVLRDAAGILEWQDSIIRRSEKMQTLAGAIMVKYEAEGRDLAQMLEVQKSQEEVQIALRFGFDFELLGRDIVELWRELRRIVSSFHPENEDVRRNMIILASKPCLNGVAKLRWISEEISMLRRMDVDLDSEVKFGMLKLKTESYISSLEKQESVSGKEIAGDEETFAAYRLCWERTWGNGFSFEDQTLLCPMQFTHCKPSRVPVDAVAGSTLQIYSISVKVSAEKFTWPLDVYGVVTARDSVDRQRNPLFIRTRNYCQVVNKDHPFLRLTGPVRAIACMDTVYLETELKVKGGKRSEDVALASTVIKFCKADDNFFISLANNKLCKIELCFETFEQSVQATIISVVIKSKPESEPFPYGGNIRCSSLHCSRIGDSAGIPSRQAVVFDSVDGKLIKERAGHLDLNRRVFSVELGGQLQFHIQRYSTTGSPDIDPRVLLFPAKRWNISEDECCLDDGSKVAITVGWSLIPSKMLTC